MKAYPNLSERRAVRIARMVAGLRSCADIRELEERFVSISPQVLQADCVAWNNWAPDWSSFISGCLNGDYLKAFQRHFAAFEKTVEFHPVVIANQFANTSHKVMKLTDFQTASKFSGNPLYREVYRHIDSRFQLAFTPIHLSDRRVLLTVNRSACDFTEENREELHYAGKCLDAIARAIEEKNSLQNSWNALCDFTGAHTGIGPFHSLGSMDLRLLTALLKQQSIAEISETWDIRRDTLDKRLSSIREILGIENTRQLLSALAELRNSHARTKLEAVRPQATSHPLHLSR
jgi:hypothetical protein